MKLKSAHIFLAAALAAFATTGCGTNNSGELSSPGYNVSDLVSQPSLVGLTVTPQATTANAGQTVQLTATATLSDGTTANASSLVTWTSTNNSLATVSASGVVTAILPGTVTITASGGGFSSSAQFTVNPFVNRLFVADNTNNAILVFATDANGATVAPLRSIAGVNTGLSGPRQIAVSGQELFVANNTDGTIRVFPLQGQGNIAPTRVIASTALTGVSGIAVLNNEVFGSNTSSIAVFSANASGTGLTPVRTITGANTLLSGALHLTIVGNQVLTANFLPTPSFVLGFLTNANGNVAPVRNLTGPGGNLFLGTVALASNATELFVSDSLLGMAFRFNANANTTDAPLSTITGLTNPRGLTVSGSELFVADGTAIKVFPSNQNGAAAPTRTILSTSMVAPNGVVVAGSF